jgi:ABC-2 type transport system permease protein
VRNMLHAEWTKLRTQAGPAWLLVTAIAATIGLGFAAVAGARCPAAACGQDPAKVSFTGVYLGQAAIAVLGVLMIGNEYSTGMIRISLTAMPRRIGVLAAKALVLTGPVLAASAIAVGFSMLAGRLILPSHGFAVSAFSAGLDSRAAFGTVMYLTLVGLISLGVATAVRDSALAVGLVLGLLYLFPILAATIPDPSISRHLQQIGPLSAGLDVQATTGLSALPLSPWQGLGVATLWAAAAVAVGGAVLRLRDA